MKSFLFLLLLTAPRLFGQSAATEMTESVAGKDGLTFLVKWHQDRLGNMKERPYGKDDISYGLMLDLFHGYSGFRLGACYSGNLSGPGGPDSVITPELGLVGGDEYWDIGISILTDYVEFKDGDSDWNDPYFQVNLGLHLPLGPLQLGAGMFFPFDGMTDFRHIGFDDLDYGLQARVLF